MVSTGDDAPTFDATIADGDVGEFSLAGALGDGPVVLAFFPGAFTPPCSNEMVALEEHADAFADAGVRLLGVSADSAFSLNAFREEYDLSFDLVSDMAGDAIRAYGLEIDIEDLGLYGVANRAVFVVDTDGQVRYTWTTEDPTVEPDYEELLDAVASLD
ncbi:redoxin domain-containing protein [Halosegnis marinus]|uniref:Redoxin domain-containing protein n=1 Tax=Halosegnis marinus TaxID=3034023 RepID=A0ABD5ZLV2_9EURY|nr:redoxin domain-containing protein [Halosegnis sp. DT85]